MKIDAYYVKFESIQASQMKGLNRFRVGVNQLSDSSTVWWYDSQKNDTIHKHHESIHLKSETFVIRFRQVWNDSCRPNDHL